MSAIHTEEEMFNTKLISDMCEEYDITSRPKLPPFDCKPNPDEFLRQLCRDGWKEKIANYISKDSQDQYVDRIKYELGILQGAGLSSYFLIIPNLKKYKKSLQVITFK